MILLAVSYTHLDVYKRQVEASTIFDSSAELSDDETTVHVSLKNKR